MIVMFEDKKFEKVNENLYFFESKYYRLFGYDISDNYCWVINPVMIETDIDIASGKYKYGSGRIEFNSCGTIPACNKFETCIPV